MKNDYSFKLVAAIVIAGLVVALISPSRPLHPTEVTTTEAVQASSLTE